MSAAAENKKSLTKAERRARREARRAKQRVENVNRAAKMHKARLEFKGEEPAQVPPRRPEHAIHVGCSGWFYWKWRGLFYPSDLPTGKWFEYYASRFDTVEINASFYSWPTVANVKSWKRQPGRRRFIYTVKVCELITHVKKLRGTKTLIKDFGLIADLLGDRMGCFLFQFPPSYRFTPARLTSLLGQLDPSRRNVVEFRHASWWNERVYDAFRKTGTIFCSCSGPRLPDVLVKTSDTVYVRLHGPERWYRHDYSKGELTKWADRIRLSGAKTAFVYFNNDYQAKAPRNATSLQRLMRARRK
jgi:uncharacterized protein YecE (DUF72 family)